MGKAKKVITAKKATQGKRSKTIRISDALGVELKTLAEVVEFLKAHPWLKPCALESLEGDWGTGKLIWAKNPGSVYWPALIARFKDEPEDDPSVSSSMLPSELRPVLFLGTTFRYAVLSLKDIILAQEDQIDVQDALVSKYNKYVVRRKWREEKSYRDAVALLKDFIQLEVNQRQNRALYLSTERKKTTNPLAKSKQNKEEPRASTTVLKNDVGAAKQGSIKRKRPNRIYSLRQVILTKNVFTPSSSNSNSTENSRCSTPFEAGQDIETLSDVSRKGKQRPKVGGAQMKTFTEECFQLAEKTFKFEPKTKKDHWKCAECFEDIEPGLQITCHDLPHHFSCLKNVSVKQKDGTAQEIKKCVCCADQLCYLCKTNVKKDELPTKCSKCDLRFHRSCLEDWPQAEIQGSSGPITCPIHFCHTCLGEQKVLNKMRHLKTYSGGKYRCLKCLSTYHKPCCLPAGSIETLTGKDLIVCPKHTLPEIKITQRRFGCLSCGKTLKAKDEERVECSLCLQIFHPKCVGYTDKEKDAQMSLTVFAQGYKCLSCRWGLYPLYGQVVWYQQPGHSFWPARILYPREAVARKDGVKNHRHQLGEYSLKYFGAQPSYYDKASRTFSLNLASVKLFTNMKIYMEIVNVKSSYEEASFFLQMGEDLRDSLLTKPEPCYKKIDRNICRNGAIAKRRKQETTEPCLCSQNTDEDACTQNSDCQNRDTAVECNENNCKAKNRCQNRMFSQKQKEEENTEHFLSDFKGWAVKAKKYFKEGDFLIEYCGEIINQSEMQYRANKKSEEDPLYMLEIDKKTFIDAEFTGNLSRLINHSCEPNCRIEKYTSADGRPVVGVFAHQNIQKGDELTFDYAFGKRSPAPFLCHCGTDTCRGFIGKEISESTKKPAGTAETPNLDLERYDKQCAKCSYGGHVLCCEFEGCFKVYHRTCAKLNREPENEWYCPDHKIKPKIIKKRKAVKKTSVGVPRKKSRLEPTNSKKKTSGNLKVSKTVRKKNTKPHKLKIKIGKFSNSKVQL